MPIDDTLYLNDLFVLSSIIDVDSDGSLISAWAEGDAADWLNNNGVTTGITFEAKFRFAHEVVKNSGQVFGRAPRNVYRAKLILLESIKVVEKGPKTPKSNTNKDNEPAMPSTNDIENMTPCALEALRVLVDKLPK